MPMSLQQLEAFLARAQDDPRLELPLATAPNAAAVAAIAHAAGFAVTEEDLLLAAGEPPEVLEVIEILAAPQDGPQAELDAFLQQVELDPDLQRLLASASDAEAVAALARVAGFGVTAQDVWQASDEEPEALEVVSYALVIEASGGGFGGDGAAVIGGGWLQKHGFGMRMWWKLHFNWLFLDILEPNLFETWRSGGFFLQHLRRFSSHRQI
jgi:predicted ribosomally synthesized peptide with nif11-like leader